MPAEQPQYEVLIVGAGFAGIGAAIELRKHGIHNVVLVDKWHAVGGTWLANTYPGVAVDIPSFVYSFSFEQRGDWSRLFAPGAELQRYAEEVVDKYGLRPRLKLNTRIEGASFDEANDLWRIATDNGPELTARFLISAIGALERPKLPDIDGVADFSGTFLHTAMWDHDVSLNGKRVAVIGTGASALQMVPEIAKEVASLTVFQRTPIWVGPRVDFDPGPIGRFLLGRRIVREPLRAAGNVGTEIGLAGLFVAPEVGQAVIGLVEGGIKAWMRTQVPDDELRAKLTPGYMLGCKRPSMSNAYLKTFTRDNVELVTESITHVDGSALVTDDGASREFDVLICATGFSVMDEGELPPFPITGRDGLDLGRFWHEQMFQAYEGIAVPGFPNAFMIPGPYAFAPGSYFWMIEAQAIHARRAILEARKREQTRIEVRPEPHAKYFEQSLARTRKTHLYTPRCDGSNTYYLNYQGEAAALRPSTHLEMWWRARRYSLDDYEYTSTPGKPARRRTRTEPARG